MSCSAVNRRYDRSMPKDGRTCVDERGPRFIPDIQKNKSVAFFAGFFEHDRSQCCDLTATYYPNG
jgi:hypothetical protein